MNIVKKEELVNWKIAVNKNKDSYGASVMDTAYYIMKELSKGATPKEAHDKGFKDDNTHSGMSAAYVAVTVARYSPRGEEWKSWARNGDKFMVDWKS